MSDDFRVRVVEFDSRVPTYWLVSSLVLLMIIVVGIPFIPFWILFGMMYYRKYLASMECVLTEKSLKVKKGLLTRVEKTVPLEKIMDMGLVQGPMMRDFGLYQLSVETAGQSAPGDDVALVGIVDAKGFREAVLLQRESLVASASSAGSEVVPVSGERGSGSDVVLGEIRDSLLRIEGMLKK